MNPLTRRRSWPIRVSTLSAVTAVALASCAQSALAAPPPTPGLPEIVKAPAPGPLTGFHGVKPKDVDAVLAKIKRPDTGLSGSDKDDWKAFYLAETKQHAAGYVNGEDGQTAGAVVRVELPVNVTVATVNTTQRPGEDTEAFQERRVKAIKEEFHIPADSRMMDSLAKDNIVLKMDDGSGRNELVAPWELTDRARASIVEGLDFRKFGTKGSTKAGDYAATKPDPVTDVVEGLVDCASGSSTRAKRSISPCAELDWERVRKKAKETVREVAKDGTHNAGIPQRRREGLSEAEAGIVVERTASKISSLHGIRTAATTAGVAAWAYQMGTTFTDKNATTLDKVAATTGIVPGLGNVVGIANGIEHRDPEAVAVNAVALAALAAAQVVPVVGEFVDAVMLADVLVETIVDVYRRSANTPPAPPASLASGTLPSLPVVKPAMECSVWNIHMDMTWDTSVRVPEGTQLVVRERGGKEYVYPASAGQSPGWLIAKNIGGNRTFDVFYRLTNDKGKTLESEKRAVLRQSVKDAGTLCHVSDVDYESW